MREREREREGGEESEAYRFTLTTATGSQFSLAAHRQTERIVRLLLCTRVRVSNSERAKARQQNDEPLSAVVVPRERSKVSRADNKLLRPFASRSRPTFSDDH